MTMPAFTHQLKPAKNYKALLMINILMFVIRSEIYIATLVTNNWANKKIVN